MEAQDDSTGTPGRLPTDSLSGAYHERAQISPTTTSHNHTITSDAPRRTGGCAQPWAAPPASVLTTTHSSWRMRGPAWPLWRGGLGRCLCTTWSQVRPGLAGRQGGSWVEGLVDLRWSGMMREGMEVTMAILAANVPVCMRLSAGDLRCAP